MEKHMTAQERAECDAKIKKYNKEHNLDDDLFFEPDDPSKDFRIWYHDFSDEIMDEEERY